MSKAASLGKGGFVDRRSDDVTHSKEDALNEREYELLIQGTYRLDPYYALEARWVVLAAGRLGMRAGEIAHMRADWIDEHDGMIKIPRHQRCRKGRDGGLCGYCRSCAKQMVDHNDELSQEDAESLMWSPKTEAAAREIPLDASTRATIAMERYFERHDEFEPSRAVVNRRVNRAAETADEVEPSDVYPHALRATCASRLSAKGLDVVALKSMMGWASFQVAKNYLAESGERTARALQRIG